MRVPIHTPPTAPEGSRDALKELTERLGGTLHTPVDDMLGG